MAHCSLFLLFSVGVLFTLCSSNIITKSVILTPSNNNKNGVQVETNSNNMDVSIGPNGWDIAASSNKGWHLHISLNDRWKFVADRTSIITLKTYSNSPITHGADIIFAFTQNSNKYISTKNVDEIYPACNPLDIVSFADGDIAAILETNNNDETREYKATNGLQYESIPIDIDSSNSNTSPLIIELSNNPIEGWSKYTSSSYNDTSCIFEPFSTDNLLNIYISAADIGTILNIEQIEVEFAYNSISTEIRNELEAEPEGTMINEIASKEDADLSWNNNGSFIESNTKTIVMILIGITICLCILCISLLIMVYRQSVENKKDDEYHQKQIAMTNKKRMDEEIANMEGKVSDLEEAVIDRNTASLNAATESITITDYDANFEANLVNINLNHLNGIKREITAFDGNDIINIHIDNDDQPINDYIHDDDDDDDDDNDVILDMVMAISTAGQ